MPSYLVEWSIDIDDAETPEDAARQAFQHFMRADSIAHVFDVTVQDSDGVDHGSTQVDLDELGLPEVEVD